MGLERVDFGVDFMGKPRDFYGSIWVCKGIVFGYFWWCFWLGIWVFLYKVCRGLELGFWLDFYMIEGFL